MRKTRLNSVDPQSCKILYSSTEIIILTFSLIPSIMILDLVNLNIK